MLIMAADYVGYNISKFLCEKYGGGGINTLILAPSDPGKYNEKIRALIDTGSPSTEVYYYNELEDSSVFDRIMEKQIDLGITAWWPYIIPEAYIGLTKRGFVNTHPALLPYNRGKHPYFWAPVEGTPFGVTLHWVDKYIDHGKIIAKKEIPYTWLDTGETLYVRSREEMLELFYNNFDAIKNGTAAECPEPDEEGTFHLGKQLEPFCEIDLDKQYTARTLFNIMRGRMFNQKGEAFFKENGVKYYLSLKIQKDNE